MTYKTIFQKLFDRYVASYRSADAVGCASVFTSEAELYSPYGPAAVGRTAIEATHQEWVNEGAENKEIDVVDAGGSGDVGWCLAHYSEGSTGRGTSLNVLGRQPDANWQITHCSLNEAP